MSAGDTWFVMQASGEEEPEVPSHRPWHGPPEDELGVAVPLGLVLGRGDRAAVGLSHAVVHPSGVLLQLHAVADGLSRTEANGVFHEQYGYAADDLPTGLLRFGVELPGGDRVSNVSADGLRMLHEDAEPEGPVLVPSSGGGGQGYANRVVLRPGYWLWPLPGPGRLSFACEWPLVGIPQTTVDVDTRELVAAADRATSLRARS